MTENSLQPMDLDCTKLSKVYNLSPLVTTIFQSFGSEPNMNKITSHVCANLTKKFWPLLNQPAS